MECCTSVVWWSCVSISLRPGVRVDPTHYFLPESTIWEFCADPRWPPHYKKTTKKNRLLSILGAATFFTQRQLMGQFLGNYPSELGLHPRASRSNYKRIHEILVQLQHSRNKQSTELSLKSLVWVWVTFPLPTVLILYNNAISNESADSATTQEKKN